NPIKVAGLSIKHRPSGPMRQFIALKAKDYRQFGPQQCAAGRTELLDRPDEVLDLLGMRTELLGKLVEIGIGDLYEAGLVDVGDDLDADRFQLVLRLMLEFDGFR